MRYATLLLAFLVIGLASISRAEAGIPIPCTGETVVKVAELPPSLTFPGPGGEMRHVDLGYKIQHCFSGEWVGYLGQDRYIPLSQGSAATLAALAGLKQLPTPPGFWSAGSVYGPVLLWIGIGAFAIFGAWRQHHAQAQRAAIAEAVVPVDAVPQASAKAAASADWMSKAAAAMTPSGMANAASSQQRVMAGPRAATRTAAQKAAFGRRG